MAAEVGALGKYGRYDLAAFEVAIANMRGSEYGDASLRRILHTVVDAGDDDGTGAVDHAALSFVEVDATISVVETVDVFVCGWYNLGAVGQSETEEAVMAASGLDTFYEEEFAAAFLVVNEVGLLRL